MNVEETIKYWLEIAEYDYNTALAMLEKRRFLYVGFMCHQVIEKALKAVYVKSLSKTPPYTHNLSFMAQASSIYDIYRRIIKPCLMS